MRLLINGKPIEAPEGHTLGEVLTFIGIEDRRGVAVAVDGEIVPRGVWGIMALEEGQSIEVVRAVQGG
ncbi:MAG: sulfur carrier protein ThiS [Actinomycetota bacterium]